MKKFFTLALVTLMLAGCATPVTMLKNPKSGQVARCGGEVSGSMAGGMIGYDMQKKQADKCVSQYKAQGFKVVQ